MIFENKKYNKIKTFENDIIRRKNMNINFLKLKFKIFENYII